MCSNVDDFNNRNLFLTAKSLKHNVIDIIKFEKAFSKFYHRHSELIVKYNIGLKFLLQQGISEPIFYGDLVYKFKRIVGKPNSKAVLLLWIFYVFLPCVCYAFVRVCLYVPCCHLLGKG